MSSTDLAILLASLERVVMEAEADMITKVIGELEVLKAKAWARLVSIASADNGQPEAMLEDRWLTIPEVAARFQLSTAYVYELARQGDLPVLRKGKYIRVSASALRGWEVRHQKNELDRASSVTLLSPHDRTRGTPNPKASRAHASPIRRTRRRASRDRGPVGTG